jgi:putative membrane protein
MKNAHTAIVVALGLALATLGARAQTAAEGQPAPHSPTQQRGAQHTGPAAQQAGQQSKLEGEDRRFLENAVQGSFAEIEGSKLALEKTKSQDVKEFAQMMIKDHEKMGKEAAKLASSKGMEPPTGPSAMQVTEITALKALSGGAFDAMYVNRIGVASHEATVEMFEKASREAHDADVKSMATKALPKLREHLKMAQALNKKQDSK